MSLSALSRIFLVLALGIGGSEKTTLFSRTNSRRYMLTTALKGKPKFLASVWAAFFKFLSVFMFITVVFIITLVYTAVSFCQTRLKTRLKAMSYEYFLVVETET